MVKEKTNMGESSLKNKTTFISKIIKTLKMSLAGWDRVGVTDEFEYNGKVLAGSNAIRKIIGIYSPFADESNLITSKRDEVFFRQKHELNTTVNKLVFTSEDIEKDDQEEVIKMCKTTLQNIGDIILNSKDFMGDMFNRPKDDFDSKDKNEDLF